jgi:hypothetical protein
LYIIESGKKQSTTQMKGQQQGANDRQRAAGRKKGKERRELEEE